MKTSLAALALGLASIALPTTAGAAVAQEAQEQKQIVLSEAAGPAITALENAQKAQDWAALPGLYDAAIALAAKPDDVYYANVIKLRAGVAMNDPVMQGEAVLGMADSGFDAATALVGNMVTIANANLAAGNLDLAGRLLERADALRPNDPTTNVLLGEVFYQNDNPEAATQAFQKAIALQRATGQEVSDSWYRRAIQTLQEAEKPVPASLILLWASDYPTSDVLGKSVRLYRPVSGLTDAELIDLWRFQRAVDAMVSEYEFVSFADELFAAGYPGEALAVLEEGIAAGVIDPDTDNNKRRLSRARENARGERDTIGSDASAARSAAEAGRAIAVGDLYYGYDDFANAATLYEVALGKPGADADLVNLRLGAARARAGDHAGARSALEAVSGKYETLAKFWLAWVDSQG
ncbi:hypothetical protein [Sphingomicrobium astaxanthinifaciens]|uniref:hypothetical protein n=1 Tax=Sphingomicrobium astaxanthinifaciens TaxID=1227949 RepID=UPI001FCAAF55|nr:hypothetical protein [Sphingomicrobium astaxanthinifaciens]MCJ7422345.1 hypothetical protein [Sphingomicrobium astaxanthinifaciens]